MLSVLIVNMRGGTYSLQSIPNDIFKIYCEEVAEEIFFHNLFCWKCLIWRLKQDLMSNTLPAWLRERNWRINVKKLTNLNILQNKINEKLERNKNNNSKSKREFSLYSKKKFRISSGSFAV